MNRFATSVMAMLMAGVMGLSGLSPAYGIGDVENSSPKMVGGGWVAIGNPDTKVTFGIDLPCPGEDVGFNPQPDPPGRLEVNWEGSRFHLDEVSGSACSLGGPDTHEGSGVGSCNGQPARVSWSFTDNGRQGIGNPDIRPDTARLEISGTTDACTLSLAGPLGGGNIDMVAAPEPD